MDVLRKEFDTDRCVDVEDYDPYYRESHYNRDADHDLVKHLVDSLYYVETGEDVV